MMGHFDRIRVLSLHSIKDIKIVSDHRAILEAIKTGNKEGAKANMEKHLMRYKFDKEELEKNYYSQDPELRDILGPFLEA